ncbi:MAG: hypothetical protein NVSMB25_23360 [Thermoleophilaceae bacterium]
MKQARKFTVAVTGGAILATAIAPVGVAGAKSHKHSKSHAINLSGVVVHENDSAQSFVVAERSGQLEAIHGRRPAVGSKVTVRAVKLANGTLAEKKLKVVVRASARRVKIAGVVSAEDPAHHELVISSSGTSIVVKDDPSTAGDATPPVGEAIEAEVELGTDGDVSAEEVRDQGRSSTFRIEGKVLAVDAATRTLSISADDNNETGDAVKVLLPAGFDPAAYRNGGCVELTVTKNADGSLTAVQSFGDDNAREADNAGHGRGRGGPGDDRSGRHEGGEAEARHGEPAPGGTGATVSEPSHSGDGSTGTSTETSTTETASGGSGSGGSGSGSGRR